MIFIKRLLKSSLKHFIGKYLKNKNLLDELEVIGKKVELKNIELDTEQIYETSKKYLHDSFNRINVKRGEINSIVEYLSNTELVDNIFIDGVELDIKTTNKDIDIDDSVIQSTNIDESTNQQTDSIFAFERGNPENSDSSEDSTDSGNPNDDSPLKGLFTKTKRNISLISKLLKQLGNATIVISNIKVCIDEFTVTSGDNKIVIKYNPNHPNQMFPFDYFITIDGLSVQFKDEIILKRSNFKNESRHVLRISQIG